MTFVIDNDNNITAHTEAPVRANESTAFASQKELAKLTGAGGSRFSHLRNRSSWRGLASCSASSEQAR